MGILMVRVLELGITNRAGMQLRPTKTLVFVGTPAGFGMLGGSEFRLRQGFACGKTLARTYVR